MIKDIKYGIRSNKIETEKNSLDFTTHRLLLPVVGEHSVKWSGQQREHKSRMTKREENIEKRR